jgi:hypothetical protein
MVLIVIPLWLIIGVGFGLWAGHVGAAKVPDPDKRSVFGGGLINGLLIGPFAVPLAYWF